MGKVLKNPSLSKEEMWAQWDELGLRMERAIEEFNDASKVWSKEIEEIERSSQEEESQEEESQEKD